MRAFLAVGVMVLASTRLAIGDGFTWTAPRGCPDADAARQRIEPRLAEGTIDDVGAIEVTILRTRVGFTATIDARAITVANAVRTLEAARCAELADAVAVVIARIATEAQQARVAEAAIAAMPVAEAVTPVAVAPVAASVRATPTLRPAPVATSWTAGVRALGLSGIGAQPKVAVGGEVAIYARRRDLLGELAYAHWVPDSTYLNVGAPARVDISLTTFALRFGWAPQRMPIRAYVVAEAGELTGQGVALMDNRRGTSRWMAMGAGFGVGWPIARLVRVIGTLELAAPFDRTRFLIGETEVHRPSSAVARSALGLEVGW